MKKHFIILFVIAVQVLQAQNPPILNYKTFDDDISELNNLEKGDYYQDTNNVLNQFIGTWQYQNANTTFTLKIRKVNQFLYQAPNAEFYWYKDIILVNYKLIKNNMVLVDELDKPLVNTLINSNTHNKYFRFNFNEGIYGTFQDLTNKVFVDSILKRILTQNGETPKLHFLVSVNGSTHRANPREFYQGMSSILSVPNNIELFKID